MDEPIDELSNPQRRSLLQRAAWGLSIAPATLSALAAEPALLSVQDPAAKAVHYVEDASHAQGATSGADCSNCSIYGATGADRGTCTLFPGKLVKASGWCSSWSGM